MYTATAVPNAHANMNLKTRNRNESFLGEKRPSPSFRRAEQHLRTLEAAYSPITLFNFLQLFFFFFWWVDDDKNSWSEGGFRKVKQLLGKSLCFRSGKRHRWSFPVRETLPIHSVQPMSPWQDQSPRSAFRVWTSRCPSRPFWFASIVPGTMLRSLLHLRDFVQWLTLGGMLLSPACALGKILT